MAIAAYEKALTLDQVSGRQHCERVARLHYHIARTAILEMTLKIKPAAGLSDVLADAEKAVALVPDVASIIDTRGHIPPVFGRTDAALADLDIAIVKGAHFLDAFYGRARAHELIGNKDAAIADYLKSLGFEGAERMAPARRRPIPRPPRRSRRTSAGRQARVQVDRRARHPWAGLLTAPTAAGQLCRVGDGWTSVDGPRDSCLDERATHHVGGEAADHGTIGH